MSQPLPPYAPMPPQGPPPQGPPAGGDADATQYIPPVASTSAAPGVLPPKASAESTQFPGAQPLPQGPDVQATQYLPPVAPGSAAAPTAQIPPVPTGAPYGIRPGAPGDRQPPAEFDNLFRESGGGTPHVADATQQLPRFADQPQHQQHQPHPAYQRPPQSPQRAYAPYKPQAPDPDAGRRRSSRVPLIAAVVVGCAVLGLGVSAVMFGGDGDDDAKNAGASKNVAAGSPAPSQTSKSPSAPTDPAEPQAKALDKLLADSNNSRDSVIRSVENIKQCKNLDQAAADLRAAANQRRGLVTRLQGLTVDQLPDHARLTASLTEAWQASATADDHYAAWADQTKGEKGCKDGKARGTKQLAKGNRASGEATKAKREASGLWNAIAKKYGLTERRSDQL
ncbi:hypothetical protein [Streptomyces sp. PR69]|uniref:hypothetical protein n=1 Tax=Streptomyces sp. PR69 TaxID=2984950 RepID=UPI002B27BFDF|nr:hypothetical protein [Streptomyces sp. PR69]